MQQSRKNGRTLMFTGLIGVVVVATISYFTLCLFLLWIAPTRPLAEYRNQTNNEYRYTLVNDVKIRYVEQKGKGPTLVFLHGFGSNVNQWNDMFGYITNQEIVAFDSVGFGGSSRPNIRYDLTNQATYIVKALHNLKKDKAIIIGHSMGASLAATIASMEPDLIVGVVMISPSGYPDSLRYDWPKGLALKPGIFNSVCYWVSNSFLFQLLFPDNLARQMLSVTASYDQSFVDAISTIKQKSLLIWSESDNTSLPEYKSKYLEKIKGLTYIGLPDSVGHNINHSQALIARSIIEYFEL